MKKIGIIPTMPGRENVLFHAVNSLAYQLDELIIYCNGFSISDLLFKDLTNVIILQNQRDYKSAARFTITKKEGYLFLCDDDLFYPIDYVLNMVNSIEKYNRKAVISLHGKIINYPIISLFGLGEGSVKQNYPCRESLLKDIEVHIGGTGCMAFHSDTIKINIEDFINCLNLDDAQFSILSQSQGIPIIVSAHKPLEYLHPNGWTIWEDTVKNPKPLLDLINSHNWKLFNIIKD